MARDMGKAGTAVVRNPLGEVPFFELQNRPLGEVRSEIANLVIPQQRMNDLSLDIQAVAKFGAYRQKWAIGIEVPRDPVTGQPIAPYEANVANLFVAEGDGARFGDLVRQT